MNELDPTAVIQGLLVALPILVVLSAVTVLKSTDAKRKEDQAERDRW